MTPTPRSADDPVYRIGPAPERLAGALFHGVHEGMITHDQVPTWPGPDGTNEQWARHLIAIDKVCRDSGATASYAANVKMDAVVMTCPWWCEVKHPQIVSRFDAGAPQTLPVVKCTPDKGDGLGDDFTITIEEYEDAPDVTGRRLQRRAVHRRRWEIALLGLAVGHWAYHKNREWDLVVKDLITARGLRHDLDAVDDAGPSTAAPSHSIDLTAADERFRRPSPDRRQQSRPWR